MDYTDSTAFNAINVSNINDAYSGILSETAYEKITGEYSSKNFRFGDYMFWLAEKPGAGQWYINRINGMSCELRFKISSIDKFKKDYITAVENIRQINEAKKMEGAIKKAAGTRG